MYTVKTTFLLFKTRVSLGSSGCPRIHSPSVSAFQGFGVQASTSTPTITDHTLRKRKHCYFTVSNPLWITKCCATWTWGDEASHSLVLHTSPSWKQHKRLTSNFSLWGLILSSCHMDSSGIPLTLLFGQKMHWGSDCYPLKSLDRWHLYCVPFQISLNTVHSESSTPLRR